MKPQQQKRKEPNGDCLRACVASLLEVPIIKVPDFVTAVDDGDPDYPAWWKALQGWLADMGLWFLEVQLPPNMPWMPLPLPSLCILFGETAAGVKHAIVGRCEGADYFAVFNPWPEAEFANGVGALGFILPRDPSLTIKFGIALDKIVTTAASAAVLRPTGDTMKLGNCYDIATDALQRRTAEIEINGKPHG